MGVETEQAVDPKQSKIIVLVVDEVTLRDGVCRLLPAVAIICTWPAHQRWPEICRRFHWSWTINARTLTKMNTSTAYGLLQQNNPAHPAVLVIHRV
jgi:hypothetical protein